MVRRQDILGILRLLRNHRLICENLPLAIRFGELFDDEVEKRRRVLAQFTVEVFAYLLPDDHRAFLVRHGIRPSAPARSMNSPSQRCSGSFGDFRLKSSDASTGITCPSSTSFAAHSSSARNRGNGSFGMSTTP